MNINAAFKGDYIAAVEFEGKTPTLTIARVAVVELEGEDGTRKSKPVVYFRETKRGWVMCRTTAASVAAMFGVETSQWAGKRVTLLAREVDVGSEKKPAIRVKGSPDISAPITFTLKLPRKRPQQITLTPTAPAGPEEAAP